MCLTNTIPTSQEYYLTGYLLIKIPVCNKVNRIVPVPIININ